MKTFFTTALTVASLSGMFGGSLQAAPPASAKIRIALIVESTVDDKGWCQSMHDAILAVQKKRGAANVE